MCKEYIYVSYAPVTTLDNQLRITHSKTKMVLVDSDRLTYMLSNLPIALLPHLLTFVPFRAGLPHSVFKRERIFSIVSIYKNIYVFRHFVKV